VVDHGGTIFKSDTASTSATEVIAGLDLSQGFVAAAAGSKLVFVNTDANGTELWVTDGAAGAAHTFILKDILPGAASGNPKNLTTVGNQVYFQASDGNFGIDLWVTDGTVDGTHLVKHIESPVLTSSGPQQAPDLANMTAQDGRLYFGASDGANGIELWRSDGTAAGTQTAQEHRFRDDRCVVRLGDSDQRGVKRRPHLFHRLRSEQWLRALVDQQHRRRHAARREYQPRIFQLQSVRLHAHRGQHQVLLHRQ